MCFVVGVLHVLCLSCGAFSPDASEPKFSSSDNKFYGQNLADMLSILRTKTWYGHFHIKLEVQKMRSLGIISSQSKIYFKYYISIQCIWLNSTNSENLMRTGPVLLHNLSKCLFFGTKIVSF